MPKNELGIMTAKFFTNSKITQKYKSLKNIKETGKRIGLIQDYNWSNEVDKFFKNNPKNAYYAFGDDVLPDLITRLEKNSAWINRR